MPCLDAGEPTHVSRATTAVGADLQVSCACRRPHALLTSARPCAHRSDARSLGRSTSSASFVLIALEHVHLLEQFDAGADRRGHAAWCCIVLHVPQTQSEGCVFLADAWGQCSMLVELCACLHCDALDLPHVLVAVSICDLSCFGHVCMVLYINILWYVRAPAPSMVPGPAIWLLTSTTRR